MMPAVTQPAERDEVLQAMIVRRVIDVVDVQALVR
jgi:hypothetical protein